MVNLKISELNEAAELQESDFIPVVQDTNGVKITNKVTVAELRHDTISAFVDPSKLSLLSGLTGDVQTQLDNKQPKLNGSQNQMLRGDGTLSSLPEQLQVINNLTSTSTTAALSANMGRKLNNEGITIYRHIVNNGMSWLNDVIIEDIGNHSINILPQTILDILRIKVNVANLRSQWNDIHHDDGLTITDLVVPFTVRLMPSRNFMANVGRYYLNLDVFDSMNNENPIRRDESYSFFVDGNYRTSTPRELRFVDYSIDHNCLLFAIFKNNSFLFNLGAVIVMQFNMSFSFSNNTVSYSINPISIV
jgi:hypothetical protein